MKRGMFLAAKDAKSAKGRGKRGMGSGYRVEELLQPHCGLCVLL